MESKSDRAPKVLLCVDTTSYWASAAYSASAIAAKRGYAMSLGGSARLEMLHARMELCELWLPAEQAAGKRHTFSEIRLPFWL